MVFALAISLTMATWYLVRLAEHRRIEERFRAQAELAADRIQKRMKAHEQILLGAATMVSLKGSITREEWQEYEASLGLPRLFPGIQGLGFVRWVSQAGLGEFLKHKSEDPGFTVFPPGPREHYAIVEHLAPANEGNRKVLGFDAFSEPLRRTALQRAADTGEVAVSSRTILIREPDRSTVCGTVLSAPVFRRGLPLGSVDQRRAALMGWTSLPTRMPDLMAGILGTDFQQIDLELFEGTEAAPAALLFDSDAAVGDPGHPAGPPFTLLRRLDVGGLTWTLRIGALPSFVQGVGGSHHMGILAAGAAISLLLLALLKSMAGSESRAEALANSRAQALLASETRFKDIFDNAMVGFYATAPDGRILTANPALLKMLGYGSVAEVPNLNLSEPYAPGYSRGAFMDRLEREGTIFGLESEWRTREGAPLFVRESARVVRGEAGQVLRYEGTVEDISERVASEHQLREAEARHRALLDAIPDLFFVLDSQGVYLDYHAARKDLLAAPPEAFLGKRPSEVLPAQAAETICSALSAAAMTGARQSFEYDLPIGGASHRFEASLLPFGTGQYLMVVRDATDRLRGEEALVKARKAESLGLMAGGIAHDFNNIFQALGSNLEIAQTLASEPREQSALARATHNLARAADLAQRMLEFSGRSFRRSESVDLNAIVGSFQPSGTVGGLRFARNLQPELPRVDGDAAQLRQVLHSLVSNALDSLGAGPGEVHLTTASLPDGKGLGDNAEGTWVMAPPEGPLVRLSVADSGCGASPQVVERMFDPFYSTKAPGRGLGLAAVQGILKGHRAGLQVKTSPGLGSSFHIYFPALSASAAETDPKSGKENRTGRKAVLFADDDEDLRQVVGEIIRDLMGLRLFEARDGQEAVEIFQRHGDQIGLVLLDATMPRLRGPDAFEAIRNLRPGIPGILISGFAEETTRDMASRSGFQRSMKKPFTLQELKDCIGSALGA